LGAPHFPLFSPPEGSSATLPDVFFLTQNLPALAHKANASEINQLSTLSEWVCEIAAEAAARVDK
jgi:hypothetical protein